MEDRRGVISARPAWGKAGQGWHSVSGPVFHPGRAEEGWGGCRQGEAGRQAGSPGWDVWVGLGQGRGARGRPAGRPDRQLLRCGLALCGLGSGQRALGWGLGTLGLLGWARCGLGGRGGPGGRLRERSRLLGLVGEGRPRLRPYHPERARSRLISEAKQGRAWLVLGWETAWEYRVL